MLVPSHTAGVVTHTNTRVGCGFGRCLEFWLDLVLGRWDEKSGIREPGGNKTLEEDFVVVAHFERFARFLHGVAAELLGEERAESGSQETVDALQPLVVIGLCIAISISSKMGKEEVPYVVVHVCGAHDEGSIVVGPLVITRALAVIIDVDRISDMPCVLVEQRSRFHPIVDLLRPVGVRLVIRVASKSGRELEQNTVRDCVLHRITGLVGEKLPPQSTTARRRIPSGNLRIEDTLRQRQPREPIFDIGELQLCRKHRGQTPETLVIISLHNVSEYRHQRSPFAPYQVGTVVRRHVVSPVTRLMLQTLTGLGIVGRVAGVLPVLQRGHEQG